MPTDSLSIRKLLPSETAAVKAHFLRLDPEDRYLRFFGHTGEAFIDTYCEKVLAAGHAVLGCFIEGELRAVGELCRNGSQRKRSAEVAITVEKPYQNRGIGTELLRRLVRLARNRSVRTLHLFCLLDNVKMQHVARKLGGMLTYKEREVEANINPPWPTYWSLMEEALADGRATLHKWSLERARV